MEGALQLQPRQSFQDVFEPFRIEAHAVVVGESRIRVVHPGCPGSERSIEKILSWSGVDPFSVVGAQLHERKRGGDASKRPARDPGRQFPPSVQPMQC